MTAALDYLAFFSLNSRVPFIAKWALNRFVQSLTRVAR